MTELINFKNKVRDVLRKYEEIIFPFLRLIWCFLVFLNIHSMFPYMDLFDRTLVLFLIAVLATVLPDGFLLFAAGAVIGVNCFTVNLEVGLAFVVFFCVIYCLYVRFFPKYSYAIFLVTICYSLGMPYLAPIIIVVLAGLGGALPAAFGVMLHFFAVVTSEIQIQLASAEDEGKVEVLGYFIEHILKNKEMYMVMLAFALTVVLASVVYRLSFPFSHYAAIAAACVFAIVLTLIAGSILKQTPDTSAAMGGALVGLLICLVLETCKGVLDFPHTQRVQFEDDEYYYYVKAVPKLDAPKKKKKPRPKKAPVKGARQGAPGQGPRQGAPGQGAPGQEPRQGVPGQGAPGQGPRQGGPAGAEKDARRRRDEEFAKEQSRTAIRADGAPAKRIAEKIEEAKKNRPVESPQEMQARKQKELDDFEDLG